MKKVTKWLLNKRKIGIFIIPFFLLFPIQLIYATSTYPNSVIPYIEKTSLFSDIFRIIIWAIIKFFHNISYFFEESLWKIFKLPLNFFSNSEFGNLTDSIQVISLTALVVVVVFLGLQIWHYGKVEPLKKFATNLVLVFVIVIGSDQLLNYTSSITSLSVQSILGKQESISNSVIVNYLYDVEYIMKNGVTEKGWG